MIDPRDVAEVAVAALTTSGHASRTYTLTGPDLLRMSDQVKILRKVLGRPIDIFDVPLDTAKQRLFAAGRTRSSPRARCTASASLPRAETPA